MMDPLVTPEAAADSYAVDEDSPLTISATGVLGNDSDFDSDPLTANLVTGVSSGSLVLQFGRELRVHSQPEFQRHG